MPWPALGPVRRDDSNERDLTGGHPTVPGDLDRTVYRHGLPSPGNGMPGIPRVRHGRRHGPGIPGMTPTGPTQPGVTYDGEREL
jgi:hypothetical protein